MWSLDGISHKKTETGLPFHGESAMVDDTYLTGKIRLAGEHLFVGHRRFVKALEDEATVAKQAISLSVQTLAQFWTPFARLNTEKYYASAEELAADIASAYVEMLHQLYDAGCRNVQLDGCTWGMMADKTGHPAYDTTQEGLVTVQKMHKDLNNQVIAGAPGGREHPCMPRQLPLHLRQQRCRRLSCRHPLR